MDNRQDKLESLKLVKEWSVWLITLQTGLCAFLWNVLKEQRMKDMSGISLHLGWLAFSLSVVIATVLVSRLPIPIEKLTDLSSDSSNKSILAYPLPVLGINIKVKTLLAAEHLCFLVGILFVIIFIIREGLL